MNVNRSDKTVIIMWSPSSHYKFNIWEISSISFEHVCEHQSINDVNTESTTVGSINQSAIETGLCKDVEEMFLYVLRKFICFLG